MKQKFLVTEDYGTGGIWLYILADKAEEILCKYPCLEIVFAEPKFLTEKVKEKLIIYDIEEEPPKYLQPFLERCSKKQA